MYYKICRYKSACADLYRHIFVLCILIFLRLHSEHFGVFAVLCQQFVVTSLLNKASCVEHINSVRDASGGQTVRNEYDRFVVGAVQYGLVEVVFRHGIQRA